MNDSAALDQLCRMSGISPSYADVWGKIHEAKPEHIRSLLAAMGIAADDPEALQASLETLESRNWQRILPNARVVRESGAPFVIPVTLTSNDPEFRLIWTLQRESGESEGAEIRLADLEHEAERDIDGVRYHRYLLRLPVNPGWGYHRLAVSPRDYPPGDSMSLIVTPDRCYEPAALHSGERVWGFAVQLYTLRSARNWGMGDFTDLKNLVGIAHELGANVIGLNPLHALYPHNPGHISPYSPSSRLFLNLLYLDVEAIPDFEESALARELVQMPGFQERLAQLRETELVDYRQVAELKLQVLEILYRHFRECHLQQETSRGQAFRAFQTEGGPVLHRQALFEALQEEFYRADSNIWGWPVWPEPFRHPDAPEVAQFAADNVDRVEYYQYLHWLTQEQLGTAAMECLRLGYKVGIYQDLAVSVDRGGAEAWGNQHLYALTASIGAPPDELALQGQDWGLPPLVPDRLRESAYTPYIATLRANMRHAGALRIDHVMALLRLYWIPPQASAAEGIYVHYPLQDLLGILALESQRNQCMVIGEDLGTVPEEIREALGPLGVLSYRLLLFEKDEQGNFNPPDSYPRQALIAVSTHDLPTLAGYWEGVDLALREKLKLFPTEELRQSQTEGREKERAGLLKALDEAGLLPEGYSTDPAEISELTPALVQAIHAFLARSPSSLMVIQPEDMLGQRQQVNLPGTVDQYPNWQRKLTLTLEAFLQDDRVRQLTQAMCQERGD
ncbi:4-alpha-glucanotransferase [Thermithiobacillus plumbiphilus]|uniref:4-alpha-glucanotransferase n=1 Tax=Thermithiobacillus plumbiphilus TaxID=1729899 RepID=A0ABU9D6C8_9PROT